MKRHNCINSFFVFFLNNFDWVCYALSFSLSSRLSAYSSVIISIHLFALPDDIMTFVQNSRASWSSWRRFITLMVLRLWMQRQFVIFMINLFAAATFPIAMDDCAAAIRTVSTFRRMAFLFLMNNRWHIFDLNFFFSSRNSLSKIWFESLLMLLLMPWRRASSNEIHWLMSFYFTISIFVYDLDFNAYYYLHLVWFSVVVVVVCLWQSAHITFAFNWWCSGESCSIHQVYAFLLIVECESSQRNEIITHYRQKWPDFLLISFAFNFNLIFAYYAFNYITRMYRRCNKIISLEEILKKFNDLQIVLAFGWSISNKRYF